MARLIYAVDDDAPIRDLLERNLAQQGYRVVTFPEGESFLRALEWELPDIALIDWMLPGRDGIELCGILRAGKETRSLPIIMLTARDTEIDTVVGLEAGADDYIAKPFSIRTLCARIRTIFARIDRWREMGGDQPVIERAGIRVDVPARAVWRDGEEIQLRRKEFDLLLLLMQAAGRVLTREYLLDTVWGADYEGSTRTVDMHILQIRKRLYGGEEGSIQTLRGVGYRFREEQSGE